MKGILYVFLFLFFHLQSQIIVKGKVIDGISKEPIPFSSVGSTNQLAAVLTDEQGNFTLSLKKAILTDSIKIYAIGYFDTLISINEFIKDKNYVIELIQNVFELTEVEIQSKKLYTTKLGVTKYDKRNCSGFIDFENNWKGVETAIRFTNKEGRFVKLKDFNFFIIKNNLKDSLKFRLNVYSANKFYPTRNVLKKSIIFTTANSIGEKTIDLTEYSIGVYGDFYVSLECLMDKVSIEDFCFAGEITEPSFVRESAFKKWKKVRGGGAAFNVTVTYTKN